MLHRRNQEKEKQRKGWDCMVMKKRSMATLHDGINVKRMVFDAMCQWVGGSICSSRV